MLPEVGFSELLVIALVVLLVMKPEDFPLVMHRLGVWAAQLQLYVRGMSMGWQEAARMAQHTEIPRAGGAKSGAKPEIPHAKPEATGVGVCGGRLGGEKGARKRGAALGPRVRKGASRVL